MAFTLGLNITSSDAGNVANPCAPGAKKMTSCRIPRLAADYANSNPCNPCNPRTSKNPCSPYTPHRATNPCSPRNPRAAKNPCNPCAAGGIESPEISDAEAVDAYNCARPQMIQAYQKSRHPVTFDYSSWNRFSKISRSYSRWLGSYAPDKKHTRNRDNSDYRPDRSCHGQRP